MAAKGTSLGLRAMLALLLTLGFYALALGIAGGLLYLPYRGWQSGRIHVKGTFFCLVGAGIILWTTWPRRVRFVVPGPRLLPRDQPRLFAVLEDVARRTGQAMPREVYLLAEANAFVTQADSVLGFGGRRVLGIGLPLLVGLDEAQVRGVLAHEFGHFHAGDTRLGPLVYGTRASVVRTVEALGAVSSPGGDWMLLFLHVLRMPFLGYAKLFLRVSTAVSRGQERAADALAVDAGGLDAYAAALRSLPALENSWDAFLNGEVGPVLGAGRRPPFCEGFRSFLDAAPVREANRRATAREIERPRRYPYDTHPVLPDRLEALGVDPNSGGDVAPPLRPAVGLLDGLPGVEAALLVTVTGRRDVARFKPIPWSRIAPEIALPGWREGAAKVSRGLAGLRPVDLPESGPALRALGARIAGVLRWEPRDPGGFAANAMGMGIALALLARGGRLESVPGLPYRVHLDGEVVAPFAVVEEASRGGLDAAAWGACCARLGIADVDLGAATAPSAASS